MRAEENKNTFRKKVVEGKGVEERGRGGKLGQGKGEKRGRERLAVTESSLLLHLLSTNGTC